MKSNYVRPVSLLLFLDCLHYSSTCCGSQARFMNHSCDPNCYARIITAGGDKKIVIFSKRGVYLNLCRCAEVIEPNFVSLPYSTNAQTLVHFPKSHMTTSSPKRWSRLNAFVERQSAGVH
jgi:hypothetical protein